MSAVSLSGVAPFSTRAVPAALSRGKQAAQVAQKERKILPLSTTKLEMHLIEGSHSNLDGQVKHSPCTGLCCTAGYC